MTRMHHRRKRASGRVLLVAVMSVGVSIAPPAFGSSGRAALAVPAWTRLATVARTISLDETGDLRLESKHNFTLNERGPVSGTIAGVTNVQLTAVSSTRVTVQVNIYARGGSVSGNGTGNYRRRGTTAEFSGSMSFGSGTGKYGHVHGSGLSFSGTIEEANHDAITVHVSGRVSD